MHELLSTGHLSNKQFICMQGSIKRCMKYFLLNVRQKQSANLYGMTAPHLHEIILNRTLNK